MTSIDLFKSRSAFAFALQPFAGAQSDIAIGTYIVRYAHANCHGPCSPRVEQPYLNVGLSILSMSRFSIALPFSFFGAASPGKEGPSAQRFVACSSLSATLYLSYSREPLQQPPPTNDAMLGCSLTFPHLDLLLNSRQSLLESDETLHCGYRRVRD